MNDIIKDENTGQIIKETNIDKESKEYFFDGDKFWTPFSDGWHNENSKLFLARVTPDENYKKLIVDCKQIMCFHYKDFNYPSKNIEEDPIQKVDAEEVENYFKIKF